MINIGITGGDNLVAGELVRLLINHPDSCLKWVTSNNASGPLDKLHKGLTGECDIAFSAPLLDEVDVLFCCDKASAQWVMQAAPNYEQLRIIDLTHSITHKSIIYGLCEINRKFMVHDCYDIINLPTPEAMVTLLALVPLAKNLMLSSDIIVSIARSSLCSTHISPNIDGCQDEISTVLKAMQHSYDRNLDITVATYNMPPRGITATVTTACNVPLDTVKQMFIDYYDDHNFTFTTDEAVDPSHVINTNKCLINIASDGNILTITTVADSLLKGAAGNAVHAMNLLFGLHERTGLTLKAQVF